MFDPEFEIWEADALGGGFSGRWMLWKVVGVGRRRRRVHFIKVFFQCHIVDGPP